MKNDKNNMIWDKDLGIYKLPKTDREMKYFESHDPYYALIKAEDHGEAVQLYISNVAGDSEESQEVAEELKEVSRDYALVKFSRGPGENGKVVSIKDTIEDFISESNSVLLIDGSLT